MKFKINFKDNCERCRNDLEKLLQFLENRPWKYGSRATIEIRQDYLGEEWHIQLLKIDNYEAEALRAEYERIKNKDTYDLQGLLDSLDWYDSYDDSDGYDGSISKEVEEE
jgi:hypothetical protein